MNFHLASIPWAVESLPRRVPWAIGMGGSVVAMVAGAAETPGVGTAGVVGMLIGGALSVYKLHVDSRKEDRHRGECQERLIVLERRFERVFDALVTRLEKPPENPPPPPPTA